LQRPPESADVLPRGKPSETTPPRAVSSQRLTGFALYSDALSPVSRSFLHVWARSTPAWSRPSGLIRLRQHHLFCFAVSTVALQSSHQIAVVPFPLWR
jgi:hypothetical protein